MAKKTVINENIRKQAIRQYVDNTIQRIHWISLIVAIAEAFMTSFDLSSNFFQEHKVNYLNLLAELILIFSSFIVFLKCITYRRNKDTPIKKKQFLIIIYRVLLIISITIFIFTDIYVRKKALGTYIIFLFVLQITPAYRPFVNWAQYLALGFFTLIHYIGFVSSSLNTLFGTMFVFLCFAICTDYLRVYFMRQLENYYIAEESDIKFQNLTIQSITALANAVEAKDIYTKGHSSRVAEYSEKIAMQHGFSEDKCIEIYFIALMHDVGKIGVPDTVINKKGSLTEDEYDEIKKHSVKGYEILKQITELPGISEGARWHHERYDGKGYPDGLAGESIPEIARIIAVADAYDAMTSNRSYRNILPQNVVREQIEKNMGTQFDPQFAKIMLKMIDADTKYQMHQ